MRSLSTRALGQPSETKETRGAAVRFRSSCIAPDCHGAMRKAIETEE
jgi:hypothetical protein